MDTLKINGGLPLSGNVHISGAKNSALPLFAATLLTEETCTLHNVPDLSDIRFMADILRDLGADVQQTEPNTWQITAKNISPIAPYERVRKMRASVCLMGPLAARLGQAQVSLPGGCVIGQRPIDLHIKGFEKLNYDTQIENGFVNLKKTAQTAGTSIFLGGRQGSTVTGTANILMAATLTPGTTHIHFAACEPEIVDLCNFLTSMGAQIEGIGSHTLTIQGQKSLKGASHTVIPDRIEAGTFLIAGLLPENEITIHGAEPSHLVSLIHTLEDAPITVNADNSIHVKAPARGTLSSKEVVTLPYPGYPTDIQAQLMTLLALTPGISVITERVYPNRFMHVPELQRLGAHISIEGANAIIQGVEQFSGTQVMASDLRASAALVLAGLAAEGETTIHRIYHLDRGYDRIDQKLRNLGAAIQRDVPAESKVPDLTC